jgi:hypothetical protein
VVEKFFEKFKEKVRPCKTRAHSEVALADVALEGKVLYFFYLICI